MTATVALASAATIHRRVFERYALGEADVERIGREVAVLRTAAYEGRLQQLADAFGVPAERAIGIGEPDVLRGITRNSRDSAMGIVRTHNNDLRRFLSAQPRALSQRDLVARVHEWEGERATWKARQIATTEGMDARGLADRDVLSRNNFAARVRATPARAAEARCQDLIGRGWINAADAPALPLHVGCVHGYEYDRRLATEAARRRSLWLGDWMEV